LLQDWLLLSFQCASLTFALALAWVYHASSLQKAKKNRLRSGGRGDSYHIATRYELASYITIQNLARHILGGCREENDLKVHLESRQPNVTEH